MKKIISSVISLAVSAVCLAGGSSLYVCADALASESGKITENCELCMGDLAELELDIPQVRSNIGSDSYNYYDFLDKNNASVYDALSCWTTPSEAEVVVDIAEPIVIKLSTLPGSDNYSAEDEEKFQKTIIESCKAGVDSLMYDKPEIFWMDMSKLLFGTADASYSHNWFEQNYTITVRKLRFLPVLDDAFADLEEALNYKQKLEDSIENFKVEGDTRYEQLKSIHDQIALFTYYDDTARFMSSALGSLVEPGVVCEGYSEGFKLICDRLGIPCVLVFGNYTPEDNIAHMWNSVKMEDGKWYSVDLTWDDTDGAYGMDIKYQYFLKGSKNFFKNHTEEQMYTSTVFNYPEISEDDYDPTKVQPEVPTTEPVTETETETETSAAEETSSEETSQTETDVIETETSAETETTAETAADTETQPTEESETSTETESTAETGASTDETETTSSETAAETESSSESETSETSSDTSSETAAETDNTSSETAAETETTSEITTEVESDTTEESESETSYSETSTETETSEMTESETKPETEYVSGDFNHDGYVNAADLVLCAKAVLGIEKEINCDYNGDGHVNSIDLVLIRRELFELYIKHLMI